MSFLIFKSFQKTMQHRIALKGADTKHKYDRSLCCCLPLSDVGSPQRALPRAGTIGLTIDSVPIRYSASFRSWLCTISQLRRSEKRRSNGKCCVQDARGKSARGILHGFGLKVGPTTSKSFALRVRELVAGHPTLTAVAEALLAAREALQTEFRTIERRLLAQARADARVRNLMSTPGVGTLVALTFAGTVTSRRTRSSARPIATIRFSRSSNCRCSSAHAASSASATITSVGCPSTHQLAMPPGR